MGYEERLAELGISLPQPPKPVAVYVPAVRFGNLLFISGQLPTREGKLLYTGKVGSEVTVDEAYQSARQAVLNALAIAKQELGSLDNVERVIKLVGYVASAPGFIQQPQVVNGASELLGEIFGAYGAHARVAVGAAELPLGAPVEIELTLGVSQ
ncbi:MAG: RidA family protein [Dehalococcoidia bacterium]|nr:RidA family protein [Dehalococcoidia bacterium]